MEKTIMDWWTVATAVILAVVVSWIFIRFNTSIARTSDLLNPLGEESFRAKISGHMLIGSLLLLGIIVFLSFLPIFRLTSLTDEQIDGANKISDRVMVVILPLLGTWVGTILAFYFSKENFESASRAQERILDRTVQRMEQTSAESVMLPYGRILGITTLKDAADENKILVRDLIDKLKKHSISRLVFDDALGKVKYVIHDSLLFRDAYLHLPTPKDNGDVEIKEPDSSRSLHQLLEETFEDGVKARDFAVSFAVLPRTATLADCQRAMVSEPRCRDVFLIEDNGLGRPLGWVTDQDIRANAKA